MRFAPYPNSRIIKNARLNWREYNGKANTQGGPKGREDFSGFCRNLYRGVTAGRVFGLLL